MKPNIVILTSGGGGSSVLAGIIARKGYWLGDTTKKLHFETHENSELVDLDIEILRNSGFESRDCADLPGPEIEKILDLPQKIDLTKYRQFIEKSNSKQPWLWKDPRLCYTIHFWAQLMDFKNCKFIYTTRDPYQEYVSLMNRRQVLKFSELKKINANYERSVALFLYERTESCLRCTFEELMLNPEDFISRTNEFLGIGLEMNDVLSVYRGSFGRKKYSPLDNLRAWLLFAFFRYVKRDYLRFPRRPL
jgi:hypothetical protein